MPRPYNKRAIPFPRTSKEYQRAYLQVLKAEVFHALGGKCCRCGFKDYRALQIDHIHGGGKAELTNRSPISYLRKVLKSVLLRESVYQLLCANCNWIKRSE